jgi:hypothetical protein
MTATVVLSHQSGRSIVLAVTYTPGISERCCQMRPSARQRTFAHRYTQTGKIESICLICFLTACRSQDEEEMLENEAKHVCQPDPLPSAFHFQDA